MRYFIEFSYNGKSYHGWQSQPNAVSVQEVLESALSKILRSKINVMGAGRTDTGVHAAQMFAHFDIETAFDTDNVLFKLNCFLPADIAIHRIFQVRDKAHARFDALSR
ncbi:MAG TPA: tRNA pseudouridine synthase A, partial [Aquaticitalea sp.]|nr:tRNA pseudouridine synthase A [Aquaticitalea sp.]